jgi:hypothetical protein
VEHQVREAGRHWLFVAGFSALAGEAILRTLIGNVEASIGVELCEKVGRLGLWGVRGLQREWIWLTGERNHHHAASGKAAVTPPVLLQARAGTLQQPGVPNMAEWSTPSRPWL